jgi:uncharacterized membrane protein
MPLPAVTLPSPRRALPRQPSWHRYARQFQPPLPGSRMNGSTTYIEPEAGLVRITHITYALHALGLAIGAFGASTVIGAFVFGWPSIIAVIINYVKKGDARGTWLESHFRWQIRTFWFALLWVIVAGLAFLTVIGIPLAFVMIFVLGIWAIYRIARGWLRLNDRQPMPVPD